MLVLSRKKGEKIVIGEDIVLTIVEVRGDRVRVGIDAPREVSIVRPDAIEKETKPQPSTSRS